MGLMLKWPNVIWSKDVVLSPYTPFSISVLMKVVVGNYSTISGFRTQFWNLDASRYKIIWSHAFKKKTFLLFSVTVIKPFLRW